MPKKAYSCSVIGSSMEISTLPMLLLTAARLLLTLHDDCARR